jgi:hypothetical protein
MAAELVRSKTDVIVAAGSEAIVATQSAAKTIQIVMANSGDAFRKGFVSSPREAWRQHHRHDPDPPATGEKSSRMK